MKGAPGPRAAAIAEAGKLSGWTGSTKTSGRKRREGSDRRAGRSAYRAGCEAEAEAAADVGCAWAAEPDEPAEVSAWKWSSPWPADEENEAYRGGDGARAGGAVAPLPLGASSTECKLPPAAPAPAPALAPPTNTGPAASSPATALEPALETRLPSGGGTAVARCGAADAVAAPEPEPACVAAAPDAAMRALTAAEGDADTSRCSTARPPSACTAGIAARAAAWAARAASPLCACACALPLPLPLPLPEASADAIRSFWLRMRRATAATSEDAADNTAGGAAGALASASAGIPACRDSDSDAACASACCCCWCECECKKPNDGAAGNGATSERKRSSGVPPEPVPGPGAGAEAGSCRLPPGAEVSSGDAADSRAAAVKAGAAVVVSEAAAIAPLSRASCEAS